MMHPRAQLAPTNPLQHLTSFDKWKPWMCNWVHWYKDDQTYVGYCPDNDEICRDKDPTIFLLLFEEASIEWTDVQ